METKPFHLLSCILLIFLVNHLHADSHNHQSAMDFLKPLIGTRKGNCTKGLSQLKTYLSNLGYMFNNKLHSDHDEDSFDETLEKAVRNYQTFFKLKVTGIMDADTVALMSRPRCGVADPHPQNTASHYTFFPGSPKWPPTKRNLTYSFPPHQQDGRYRAILDATKLWASVSPFKFTYIDNYDAADIKISFEYRDHGDGSPFDGPGGILAHASAPTKGRLHFDGDEKWVDGEADGAFDLQTVGLHELGHILGLLHSTDGGAVMYPYIRSATRKYLGQDDINGIMALYPS